MSRFTDAVNLALKLGRQNFSAVDEAHNELCVASALLNCKDIEFAQLDYEPILPGCEKSIDFRAITHDGTLIYIDVKTINPQLLDRWDQYETAKKQQWLPENTNIILRKDFLGGELWHLMFTARARMLEYTIDLEDKITKAALSSPDTYFVMAFCGEGFHWQIDELEDFVSFYKRGRHRADDHFSKAELHYMTQKGWELKRSIHRFACMNRGQRSIRETKLNWNVIPPIDGLE